MTPRKITKYLTGASVSFIREIFIKYSTLDTERINVSNPEAVYRFLHLHIGEQNKEHFVVLCLNGKNTIVSYHVASIGTIAETIVHPREVFIAAIRSGASSIIVAHNHPSGEVVPSKEDIGTTTRLFDAGKLIGIPLLDHIIIGDNDRTGKYYYSMKEHGYLNK